MEFRINEITVEQTQQLLIPRVDLDLCKFTT